MPKGGVRPGAGRPKGSRNKISAAATESLSELARTYTEVAMQTLVEVCKDVNAPPAARVSASSAILDRGYGKPQQDIDANVGVTIQIGGRDSEL